MADEPDPTAPEPRRKRFRWPWRRREKRLDHPDAHRPRRPWFGTPQGTFDPRSYQHPPGSGSPWS